MYSGFNVHTKCALKVVPNCSKTKGSIVKNTAVPLSDIKDPISGQSLGVYIPDLSDLSVDSNENVTEKIFAEAEATVLYSFTPTEGNTDEIAVTEKETVTICEVGK